MVLLPACLHAQQKFLLAVEALDKDSSFLRRDFSFQREFTDSQSRHNELISLLSRLNTEGFLEAAFFSFAYDSLLLTAGLQAGRRWEWAKLHTGNVDEIILNRIGFREKFYEGQPLRPAQITRLTESILSYCENNGYPFASVRLDSFQLVDQQLSAALVLKKNVLVTVDSLKVVGDAKIANAYLANYLGFRLPDVYSEELIRKMSTRIRELPFCTQARAPQVIFHDDRATITLFLNKKNASRFDFILGVLPNSNTTGKLLVTGEGELNLVNPFGRGESVFMSFSQLQPRTTEAEIRADYPYIFNFPFGVDGSFSLYKNDTLYLDVKSQVGLKYLFTGVNYFKVFFKNASSSVLNIDSAAVVQTKQLPDYLDYQTRFYGLEYRFEKTDYRFNPTRGWNIFVSAEAGNRQVKENTSITQLTDPSDPEYDFAGLYDSIPEKETQYIFRGTIQKYWSLATRHAVLTAYHGASIFSEMTLQNELFRIGGFQLLRGFDEQSIYSSQYHLGTFEYHFLLSLNSYFYLFFDGGYTRNDVAAPAVTDFPYGFGTGINFETRAGVFALSYAVGRQKDNPIEFRSAKIHFGYVNYF
jgi:outer membrane translocation and assembly module TamA